MLVCLLVSWFTTLPRLKYISPTTEQIAINFFLLVQTYIMPRGRTLMTLVTPDLSSSMRLTFVVLREMSQQLLNGPPQDEV